MQKEEIILSFNLIARQLKLIRRKFREELWAESVPCWKICLVLPAKVPGCGWLPGNLRETTRFPSTEPCSPRNSCGMCFCWECSTENHFTCRKLHTQSDTRETGVQQPLGSFASIDCRLNKDIQQEPKQSPTASITGCNDLKTLINVYFCVTNQIWRVL